MSRWRRPLGWAFSLALVALAVWALRGRWQEVAEAGGLPAPAPAAGAALLYVGANAVLASNWRELVALTGQRLRLGTAWWIWSLSQLARYSLTLAHVAGRAVLGRRYGLSPAAGAATTLLETAWYTSVVSTLALVTTPWWLPGAADYRWLAVVGIAPAALLIAGVAHPAGLVRVLGQIVLLRPVRWLTRGRLDGVERAIRVRRRDTTLLTVRYLANTTLRLSGFLLLFVAVGGDLVGDWPKAVGAYALGHLAGAAAVFAPGGLVAREGASALVLTPVLGLGPAVVLVAVVRLLEVAAELAFLGIARLVRGAGAAATLSDDALRQ